MFLFITINTSPSIEFHNTSRDGLRNNYQLIPNICTSILDLLTNSQ
jgi:hypothetical protein